jgi:hypothetical protein
MFPGFACGTPTTILAFSVCISIMESQQVQVLKESQTAFFVVMFHFHGTSSGVTRTTDQCQPFRICLVQFGAMEGSWVGCYQGLDAIFPCPLPSANSQ